MTDSTDLTTVVHGSPLAVDDWWTGPGDEIEGYDLIKDAALFALVGVPFKVFRLTFRDGIQQKGCMWRNDYVSIEFRTAPAPVMLAQADRIKSRRTDELLEGKPIADPDESLILNDGSTGIYRQCLAYLVAKGLVELPEDLPEDGHKNECRYDLPRSMWTMGAATDLDGNITDTEFDVETLFGGLKCPRGLRWSDYPSEFIPDGEEARTWYLG